MEFAEKLKFLRKNKNITQTKMACLLNITQGAYGKYERGESSPSPETLFEISNILGVTMEYLLDKQSKNDKEIKNKGIKIPVLGSIPAGIPIEAIEEVIDEEEIPAEWLTTGEYFGLKVKGNSMEPRICNGDVVIVRKQDDAESGSVCVVMVNGFDATLKQIKKDAKGISLVPFNTNDYSPAFYSNEQIEKLPVRVIGKVVELRAKF
ncbi:MAG: helix-turn-helix domain-containing protein [Christensenellales bacterium]